MIVPPFVSHVRVARGAEEISESIEESRGDPAELRFGMKGCWSCAGFDDVCATGEEAGEGAVEEGDSLPGSCRGAEAIMEDIMSCMVGCLGRGDED